MTPFHYFQRFLGDKHDEKVHRALAATAGQAGTAGRINMAMVELVFGIIPKSFRDGPNPHAEAEPLQINEAAYGVSLRLQTHDSLTFNINPRHSKWQEGVERIQTVMKRPVIIRNKLTGGIEEFVVGTESGVGPAWGKDMVEVKVVSGESVTKAITDESGKLKTYAGIKRGPVQQLTHA